MNPKIFYQCALIALSDIPSFDPLEVESNNFKIVDDGSWPAYYQCDITCRCFEGNFCMFVEGNGIWFSDTNADISPVKETRRILQYLDAEFPLLRRHNPVPACPIDDGDNNETVLFAVLLECVHQQSEALPINLKGRAKQWIHTLKQAAKNTLQTMYKNFQGDKSEGKNFLSDHHDFIYMAVRYVSTTKLGNEQMILMLVKELTEKQDLYEKVFNNMAALGNAGGNWSEEFRNKVVADALSRAIADSRSYPTVDPGPVKIALS